jgi:hypothetical protein
MEVPRLGDGVLLEKSRWGKREYNFLRSPSDGTWERQGSRLNTGCLSGSQLGLIDCNSPQAPAMLRLFIFAHSPLLSLLPAVAANGNVSKVVMNGTTYNGNTPNVKSSDHPLNIVPANPSSVMEFYSLKSWLAKESISMRAREGGRSERTPTSFSPSCPFCLTRLFSLPQWPHNAGPSGSKSTKSAKKSDGTT